MVVLLAQLSYAQPSKPVERGLLQLAFRSEIGKSDRKAVSRYLAYTELGYGHEWCAAFVSYCFGKIGQQEPKTPWSPSLFPERKRVWHNSLRGSEPTDLSIGMAWGIHVPAKGRIGHVGFVESYRQGIIQTVEGNTSDPAGKKPKGVYRKRRHWRTLKSIADWIQVGSETNTIWSNF